MKLRKLSEKVLKYMVNEYHKSEQMMFSFEDLHSEFNEFSENQLNAALWNLNRKNFISALPGDDVAYMSTLTSLGIEAGEANTVFKNFLIWVKVIKILLG